MKLGVFLSTLIAAGAHAASHGVGYNHVHKARNVNVAARDDAAVPSDRAITAADCDKGALINKLLMTVPTNLVPAMLTEPIPFHNDNPPEFWNKLDDHEKECMAALWPNDKRQATASAETATSAPASTTEPCPETTVTTTSTITQTLTVTMDAPPSSSTQAPGEVNTTTTVAVTSTETSTVAVISAESSTAMTAPYGNATMTTPAIPSGTGATNATSPSLPEFTAGQDMVGVNMSTMMAALLAIIICIFA